MVEQSLEQLNVFTESDPRPALNEAQWRIYEHHLCPFCVKVRLALAAKNVTYQNCQIDLGKKSDWHKEINGGLVPILEFPDGRLMNESQIIMFYAQEKFPATGTQLWPTDADEAARYRLA
jgi:glutathione S-transferase